VLILPGNLTGRLAFAVSLSPKSGRNSLASADFGKIVALLVSLHQGDWASTQIAKWARAGK
jgi:hypothetical protein